MKTVAILQSSYIPWKGYFDLIRRADEFILFDDAQYTTNDWRNRNQIKSQNGLLWLTIPVKNNFGQKIKKAAVANDRWRERHWKSIEQCYHKAPFFDRYKEIFRRLYLESEEIYLSQINYQFIAAICDILGIKTKISWSMDYKLIEGKTERLIHLCKQAGATEYISGPTAKGYVDETQFEKEGIKLDSQVIQTEKGTSYL